ncbi:MAG: nuclease, partial [Myxococcota bacterium]
PRVSGDDGGQPGGNIRVGCLYNPERVELDKDSVKRIGETEPVFEGGRKSLAAAFRFRPTGKTLNVINNHWASKFGSTPTYRNPEVPEVVGGEEERDGQQKVIEVYVEALKAKDPNARILSVGDFNAAGHEPPLRAHGSGVLFNLGEQVPDAERYSYVFQGIAQAIDHQFASRNLAGKVEFEYVNVNAAFADKTADHDPNLSRVDMS